MRLLRWAHFLFLRDKKALHNKEVKHRNQTKQKNIIKEVKIMFEDVGKKIKGLATVIFIINAIIFTIIGFIVMGFGIEDSLLWILIGFLIIGVGLFISWLSIILLYGYGELIDKTSDIYDILYDNKTSTTKHYVNNSATTK